jgi:hypothetical protein
VFFNVVEICHSIKLKGACKRPLLIQTKKFKKFDGCEKREAILTIEV